MISGQPSAGGEQPSAGGEQPSADGGPSGRRQRLRWQPSALRFMLPALLIILILAGLRGAATTPGWTGRYHADGVAIGAALEVLAAALLAVLVIRGRHTPQDASVAAKLRAALRYPLTAGLIAIPIVLLLNADLVHLHPRRRSVTPLPSSPPRRRRPKPLTQSAGLHIPWTTVLYGLLVVIVLAAVICCAVLLARRARLTGEPFADIGDDPGELRAAVESGRAALRRLDDDRAAIIACYAAMERSLAKAGAARGVADTPDELLARAVNAGLARGGAAGTLTALFYEARFSSHPLHSGQRDAAEHALGEIAADLDRPRPGAARVEAGAAEAGTGAAEAGTGAAEAGAGAAEAGAGVAGAEQ